MTLYKKHERGAHSCVSLEEFLENSLGCPRISQNVLLFAVLFTKNLLGNLGPGRSWEVLGSPSNNNNNNNNNNNEKNKSTIV